MGKITIAIDGGAGVGKGTTAKGVAEKLGYAYIDTGAMYRAVTLYFLDHNVDEDNLEEIGRQLQNITLDFQRNQCTQLNEILLNNMNIEDQIRTESVSSATPRFARHLIVRNFLRDQQRTIAKNGGVVMDGRDMGSVVVPDAELKIHLVCDAMERARRRQKQLTERGENHSVEEIYESLLERDRLDYTGEDATSWIANDAIEVDTTQLTMEEQISTVLDLARSIIEGEKS